MNILKFLLVVAFGVPFFSSASTLACSRITEDLFQGKKHDDVIVLQKFLNTTPETRVALVGPGSSGNETRFFGAQTLSAVLRFQERHREQILVPAGVTSATGYVGLLTRTFIERETCADGVGIHKEEAQLQLQDATESIAQIKNALLQTASTLSFPSESNSPQVQKNISETFSKYTVPAQQKFPKILSLSPSEGNVGTTIRITGENFSLTDNEVITTLKRYEHVSSREGKEIEIVVDVDREFLTKENKITTDLPYFVVVGVSGVYSNSQQFILK
jgi:peptidoglycan hydrolase-like protein with peptidoglycan-binding domain